MTDQAEVTTPERISTPYMVPILRGKGNSTGNQTTILGKTDATIDQNGETFDGKLTIVQQWSPDHLMWIMEEGEFNELGFGKCTVKCDTFGIEFNGRVQNRSSSTVNGYFNGWTILKTEKTIQKVSKVVFHLPEYPDMVSGDKKWPENTVCEGHSKGWPHSWSELQLDYDGWKIRLQPIEGHACHVDPWLNKSPHPWPLILGLGELTRSDGSDFDIDDVKDILDGLDTFLSFAFMGRTPPILPIGYDAEGNRVCDFVKGFNLHLNRYPFGWVSEERGDLLEDCFSKFMDLWNKDGWKAPLLVIVENLITSRFTNDIRAAVANIQICIEMIASLKNIEGNPHDKIEGLLGCSSNNDKLNVPDSLPMLHKIQEEIVEFDDPKKEGKKLSLNDGPWIVVTIRNMIIHPEVANRDLIDTILDKIGQPNDHEQLYNETHQLFNHYITLILLHEMGYQGEYGNRLRTKNLAEYETVPWASSTP